MLTLHISSGRAAGQLELPAPLDDLKRQLEMIRAESQTNDIPTVQNIDCPVPSLGWHIQHTRLDSDFTLQRLNQLAEVIDGMNTAGHCHLSKSLNGEFRQGLEDVLQIAVHIKPDSIDRYEVIPGVSTHQELGKWLVEHDHLEARAPEILRPYLDYRSIGIDYCNTHDGEFLADGYAGIRTGAMEQGLDEQGVLRLTLVTTGQSCPLDLPASDERMEQVRSLLGLEDFAELIIRDVKFSAPQLNAILPLDAITVEDANTLALCLQEMEQEDGALMKYCAVLEVEKPNTFAEALNIAMDRDDYELVPEDMDEYGKQVLRRVGADDEIIDTIDGYMNFAQLGEDSLTEDGVRRTEFGLVRRLSEPFPPQQEQGMQML